MLCAECKKNAYAVFCDCLTSLRNISEFGNMRQHEERLTGAARPGVCNTCLRKLTAKNCQTLFVSRIAKVIGLVLFVGIAAFATGWLILPDAAYAGTLRTAGVVLAAAGAAAWFLFHGWYVRDVYAPAHPYFVFPGIGWEPDNGPNQNGVYYIPAGEGYYSSLAEFKLVNRPLSEKFAEKVYNEAVVTGAWRQMVAVAAPKTEGEAEPPAEG